jgi:hypothetical protein
MHQCPVCREELPNEHWRVFADHTVCQKPAPPRPPEPEVDRSEEIGEASLIAKGIDRLRSAVEGAIATISTNTDAKELDQ